MQTIQPCVCILHGEAEWAWEQWPLSLSLHDHWVLSTRQMHGRSGHVYTPSLWSAMLVLESPSYCFAVHVIMLLTVWSRCICGHCLHVFTPCRHLAVAWRQDQWVWVCSTSLCNGWVRTWMGLHFVHSWLQQIWKVSFAASDIPALIAYHSLLSNLLAALQEVSLGNVTVASIPLGKLLAAVWPLSILTTIW